jgi:hypothetical protein
MNWTPGRVRIRNLLVALAPWVFNAGLRARFAFQTLSPWYRTGWESPLPDLLKRSILVRYAHLYQLSTLVETGTFLGDTPWALRNVFEEIHTVELSPILAGLAKERFKRLARIHVHQGDSTKVLPSLLKQLSRPTLFWLDGHFSGGITAQGELNTPICAEVEIIARQCDVRFVMLIDDARCFGLEPGYPTLNNFQEQISILLPEAVFTVENDMIAIVPARE